MTRTCSDCPSTISRQSKTGRCRACSLAHTNANPEIRARQRAAVSAWASQPAVKAACTARLARYAATMSEEDRERRRAHGRHIAATVLHTDAVRALSNSREAKAKAGRGRTNTVLAWCPPAYRAEYRRLTASLRMCAADARQMIEDQVAADKARMTPFERQMARIADGAAVFERQDFRTGAPAYTLGGVASASL